MKSICTLEVASDTQACKAWVFLGKFWGPPKDDRGPERDEKAKLDKEAANLIPIFHECSVAVYKDSVVLYLSLLREDFSQTQRSQIAHMVEP